jgi:hypothetical protein
VRTSTPGVISDKLSEIQGELDFYKSIFRSHHDSCLFNMKIKTINGKKVWVDPVKDREDYIRTLDKDDEVDEWLQPIKCSR